MLNIRQAIQRGNYKKNEDGSYTVFGSVCIQTYDIATEEDVRAGRAYVTGACINHRREEKEVSAVISTLNPIAKNWDVIQTQNGRVEIQNIKSDGSCELHPLDGQNLGLPHAGQDWTYGNIYQLPSDSYKVILSK